MGEFTDSFKNRKFSEFRFHGAPVSTMQPKLDSIRCLQVMIDAAINAGFKDAAIVSAGATLFMKSVSEESPLKTENKIKDLRAMANVLERQIPTGSEPKP